MRLLELIETSLFTRQVRAAMTEEEYLLLQWYLLLNPTTGDVKSSLGQIFLLFLYPKNVQSDLTQSSCTAFARWSESIRRHQ